MQRSLLATLLVLIFLGLADSWYLAESAITNTALACNISGLSGCNVVAQSVYAHLFGIPLGVYGVVFYIIFFALGAFLLVQRPGWAYKGLALLGWGGLIASAVFVYIQVFLIKALCVYCLGSAAISLLICVLATVIWKKYMPSNTVSIPPIPLPPQA